MKVSSLFAVASKVLKLPDRTRVQTEAFREGEWAGGDLRITC